LSWLLNLYETYESNLDQVGEIEKKYNGQEFTLLPISHTTQTAHIEVQITEDGEFHSATVIDKKDGNTLIPCTEDSANRTGLTIAPYPLHDKLSYVAGDFVAYGGKIKKEEPFQVYIKQLEDWVNSPYATEKLKSIYKYLKKGRLIKDLVAERILYLDHNGKLIEKWNKQYEELYPNKPEIFSVLTGGQESAFVRFNVYSPHKVLNKIWKDKEMYNSFISYYQELLGKEDLCYVTGKLLPTTEKHPNKIRNSGDKAKLISSNDSSGFTFRGRFTLGNQAASISYEVSQKAHNALKWLINRQAKIIDNRVFLIWSNDNPNIPNTVEDTYDLLSLVQGTAEIVKNVSYTNQELAQAVSKALVGYKTDLKTDSPVNILVMDSATTGRMAILYYRNLNKEHYFERLVKWHSSCIWLHRFRKDENGKQISFLGAPSSKDIAFAAYGPNASEKIIKGLMERILPCIIDDKKIPIDIIKSAFHRASNPAGMEKWEWEKTLSITCAMINRQEGLNVSLDNENNNRDYLFGRLLAIADVLERRALGAEETRTTNAIRYMNSFSKSPARTWKTIQESIQPYQVRLGTKGLYLSRLIDEVASRISFEEFNNRPLSGKYLLGFYSQRNHLYQKTDSNKNDQNSSIRE